MRRSEEEALGGGVEGRSAAPARRLLPAAAFTGLLMVLAFPRYGQDYLVWVALVPLFLSAGGAGPRIGFLSGWLAGLGMISGGFLWVLYSMRAFTGLGRAADALLFWPWLLYESLPWGALGLALGLARPRGAPAPGRILAVLPFWVGLEHFYPRLFPWHAGGALYHRPWLLQCADLFGTSGLTALVFFVNAAVYLALRWVMKRGRFPLWTLVSAAALLGGANLYGWHRLGAVEAAIAKAPELKVGVIQPVAEPEERREAVFFEQKMLPLTRSLEQKSPLDLIVWPEGADTIGFYFDRSERPRREEMNRERRTGYEHISAPIVAGTGSIREATGRSRNTAVFVLPGEWPPAGFYHKNVRVPLGEFVPFSESLPRWLRERIENVGTIEAGTDCPLFSLPARGGPFRFRIAICYEAVLPGFVRQNSRGADFLVNVTEDIWYGRTSHVGQHVSVLVLRAVENRISIVRAANAGPSGVIDPAGRMADRTEPFVKEERVVALRPARLESLYAQIGFAFPGLCLAAGVLWLGGALHAWRRVSAAAVRGRSRGTRRSRRVGG